MALALTRQGNPILDREVYAPADGLHKGAYILYETEADRKPGTILVASGSEVHIALDAAEKLREKVHI